MSSSTELGTWNCPRCEATNAAGKRFCGDCGTALDPLAGSINSYLDANLKLRLDQAIKDRFRDEGTVEVEIAEKIGEKLIGWAKLFGAFVALPTALILTILGFYGFKELSDVHKAKDEIDNKINESKRALDDSARQIQANAAENADITRRLQSGKKNADEAAAVISELQRKATVMSSQLDQVPRLTQKVDALEATVKDLRNTSSPAIMKNLQTEGKVFGIDAAHFRNVDWNKLKQAGVSFATIKATEGTISVDPEFARNWNQSKDAGILRGAYHFYRYNADPVTQADHFTSTFKQEPGDLPPAVDFEGPILEQVQLSTPEDTKRILDNLTIFIDKVRKNTGCNPIIISTGSWLRRFSPSELSSFRNNPLWIMRLGKDAQVLPPWTQWTFWQFSDALQLNGLPPTDFNAFNGTYPQLQGFIKQQCSPQ